MITCYASIAPALAHAKNPSEFAGAIAESVSLDYAKNGKDLFEKVCTDVWRECKRSSNARAWSTFKRRANDYLHKFNEIPDNAKIKFVWAGIDM